MNKKVIKTKKKVESYIEDVLITATLPLCADDFKSEKVLPDCYYVSVNVESEDQFRKLHGRPDIIFVATDNIGLLIKQLKNVGKNINQIHIHHPIDICIEGE